MIPLLAALGLSGGELVLVLVAILILFGAKKIPDFAKGLGQGIREFKKASREVQDEIERAADEASAPPPPRPQPPRTEPTSTPPGGTEMAPEANPPLPPEPAPAPACPSSPGNPVPSSTAPKI